ncbi:MAG: M23 family metallopeptidase [Candidatus Mariimomonas ferrooxydans]
MIFFFAIYLNSLSRRENPNDLPGSLASLTSPEVTNITGSVKESETLFDIFKKHGLDIQTLYEITSASKKVYNLAKVKPSHAYLITTLRLDDSTREEIKSFRYSIDDFQYLKVIKEQDSFIAKKGRVPYDKRSSLIQGTIKDNLNNSVGNSREHLLLAYDLVEIFEYEIDFVTELREGDSYRLLVEELWLDGIFKRYGNIVAAKFLNNGKTYEAYRYEVDGKADYYDTKGRFLKKALLRSPLRFKYISSGFSYKRKHPILKIKRPHLGVDYAAPRGTPVSTAGSGTVKYSGWKGQFGKAVIIKHPNGYETYYGHLSRIKKGIRKGKKVSQGEIIGYVGSTGLSTGPHLHYSIKRYSKFVNPLKIALPRGKAVPVKLLTDFKSHVESLRAELIES